MDPANDVGSAGVAGFNGRDPLRAGVAGPLGFNGGDQLLTGMETTPMVRTRFERSLFYDRKPYKSYRSLAHRGGKQALSALTGSGRLGEEALIMLASQGLGHGELLLFLRTLQR